MADTPAEPRAFDGRILVATRRDRCGGAVAPRRGFVATVSDRVC